MVLEVRTDGCLGEHEVQIQGQAMPEVPQHLEFAGQRVDVHARWTRATLSAGEPAQAAVRACGQDLLSRDHAAPRTVPSVRLLVSESLNQRLRLPPGAWLRLQATGPVWRLGPCFGVYTNIRDDPRRMFGEQTQMFRDLAELARRHGIDLVVLTPGFARTGRGWRHDADHQTWREEDVPVPDLVIRRSGTFGRGVRPRVNEDLELFRQTRRLHTLPRVCSNKWNLYQVLRRTPQLTPFLPSTRLADGWVSVYRTLAVWRDVYVKPLCGAQGVSVYHLKVDGPYIIVKWYQPSARGGMRHWSSQGTGERLRSLRLRGQSEFRAFFAKTGLHRCIVQETVHLPRTQDGRPFDFRWLVQQGTGGFSVVARVARVGLPEAVTTNLHTGGRAVAADKILAAQFPDDARYRMGQLDEVALMVARVLEDRYGPYAEAGIDLALLDDGRIALFEVNPTPGRRMLRSLPDGIRTLSLEYLLEYVSKATGFTEL